MATILNNKLNQGKDEDLLQAGPTMNASGAGAPVMGGQPKPPSTKPVASGNFANIQKFLSANKNAGQQVGGQIVKQQQDLSGKLTGSADSSKQSVAGVGSEAEAFRKGTQVANTIKNDQGDLGQFFDSYSNTNQNGPEMGNVSKDFTKLSQGSYDQSILDKAKGDLGKTSSLLGDLSQFSGNLNSESGRQQLLRQAYQSKGNYGQGANALDQAFLQRSGSPLIEQAQRDVRTQGDSTNRALSNLNKQYMSNEALTKQLAGESSNAINSALTNSISDFDRSQIDQAQSLNKTRAEQQNLMAQFSATGFANMSDIQKATVNELLSKNALTAGERTYDLNLEGAGLDPYSKKTRTNLTNQDVVDRQELARIQALTKLSGRGDSNYRVPTAEDLNAGGITVDRNKLNEDIEQSRLNADMSKFLTANNQGGFDSGQANFGSTRNPDGFALNPFADGRKYTGADMDDMMKIISPFVQQGGKTGSGGAMSDAQARQAYQALMNAGYMKGVHTRADTSKDDTQMWYDRIRMDAVRNLLANQGDVVSNNYFGGKQ